MPKKLIFATIFFAAATTLSVWMLADVNGNSQTELPLVLYTSSTCPHCDEVKKYIKDNNIEDKIGFTAKETHNPDNAKELASRASTCKEIPAELVGAVPMLWDNTESKCYLGVQPIIDYFNNRLGLPQKE